MVGTVLRLSNERAGRPVPEHIMLGTVPRLSNERAGRPVPEHFMLAGRYSPQTFK